MRYGVETALRVVRAAFVGDSLRVIRWHEAVSKCCWVEAVKHNLQQALTSQLPVWVRRDNPSHACYYGFRCCVLLRKRYGEPG